MYHLVTGLPHPVIFAVICRDIFAMLVLPEKAVMGGEERVLVEEVDEVDNVKDTLHVIAIMIMANSAILIIIIITRSTSVCASTQREAKQCGARHRSNSNWSEHFLSYFSFCYLFKYLFFLAVQDACFPIAYEHVHIHTC